MNVRELFDLIGVILMFNADSDNHVISLSCGRKTSLHTRVPISHVEPFLLYYLLNVLIYVMNRTVIFQTNWNSFKRRAKAEYFWHQWVRSGAGAGNSEPAAELEQSDY